MEPRMREDLQDLMEAVMNNSLIAERIFEQAEFDEKKNPRLINRFWRDCTLEEWRSNSAAIRIKFPRRRTWHESQSEPYAKVCPFVEVETFERMMKGRQGTGDWPAPFRIKEKPFRQVILVDGIFSIPNCEGRTLGRSVAIVEPHLKLFKFLDKFGSQLDYLRLEKCKISLGEMKWIVQKSCPNLKACSFELNTRWRYSLQPSVPRFQELCLRTPEVERRLTKLEILRCPSWYKRRKVSEIYPEDIFRSVPNLKCLKYSERQDLPRFYDDGVRFDFLNRHYMAGFPITKGLCLPLANGKYLELDELDVQMFVFSDWRDKSPHKELIKGLSRYIELTQPSSFKKFRIELDFEWPPNYFDYSFSIKHPLLDQFFLANGHLLTHLQIEMRSHWYGDGPKLASRLTGYYFPRLTHLTVYIHNKYSSYERIVNRSIEYSSKMGSLSLVLEPLGDLRKLQVFRCVAPHLPFSSPNVPIELSEMKELVFNCCNKLTVANLTMILGWMKGVKKLALILDEKTFPLVFELAPQLEQLILLGKDGGLTKVERATGEMWMGITERARQEMEWNRRTSPRETWKSEAESSDERDEERWTVVSHRQPKEKKKEKTNRKDATIVYLPRQPRTTRVEHYGQLVDDFTVFCKLQEMKSSVRIFRTKEFKYDAWTFKDSSREDWELIEYKI